MGQTLKTYGFKTFSYTNLSGNHFHEIIPNLYIGDMYSIREPFFQKQTKLVVINITSHIKFNEKLSSINYRISVEDDLTQHSNLILYSHMNKMTLLIDEYLKNNYIVLVHCVAGKQRSCAMVSAYLMKYKNMSLTNSINYIKTKRPYAFLFNVNFKKALQYFQLSI